MGRVSPDATRLKENGWIPMRDVPGMFPVEARPCRSTINRWCEIGVRGTRLKHEWLGGRRYTRQEWFDEFLRALNADAPPIGRDEPLPRTVRAEQSRKARELAAAGW
jgi:hypothetical protein